MMNATIQLQRLNEVVNSAQTLINLLSSFDWKKHHIGYRAKQHGGHSIYCKGGQWLFTSHNGDFKGGTPLAVAAEINGLDLKTKDGLFEAAKIVCQAANLRFSDYCADAPNEAYTPSVSRPIETKAFLPNAGQPLSKNFTFEIATPNSDTHNTAAKFYELKTGAIEPQNIVFLQSITHIPTGYKTLFNAQNIGVCYLSNGYAANIKAKIIDTVTGKKQVWSIQNSSNYVFALDSLPTENRKDFTLLLCAGEDDTTCINANLQPFGYCAITFGSESATIPSDYLTFLRSEFKEVVCLLDTDATGVKMAIRNETENGLPYISIADTVTDCKDVCNVYQQHGTDKLLSVVKTITRKEPQTPEKHESIKATQTVLTPSLSIVLKEGEYLSDVLTPSNILQNCIINAGTGVGKTEFALNFEDKRIICVPTRKLAKRVHKRAIDKGIDAQLFYGGTNLENQNATCIVTTYSSLATLYPVFHNSGFTLFIDEIHNATTAANPSFMLKELRSVIDSMPYFSRVIGLTGTQIYNFHAALQLPTIEVKRDIITPLPYKVIRCKTRTATAAKLVKQSIDSERTPIVFLNNKGGKLAALLVAIKDTTGLTNEQILIVNADQSGELDFETLVNSGVIGDNIKLIITTSVFKEGNDIYNTGGFDMIIMSNLIASDKRQFRGRFRNTNDVTFTILKTAKKEDKEENPHFDPFKESFSLRHFADIAANEVNNMPSQYSRELHLKTATYIQNLPLYLDFKGVCKVCELYLSNTIANRQTLIESANDTFESQQMQGYGFTFEGVFNDSDELNAEIKEEMKAATVVCREMVELDYIETLNSFENDRTIEPKTDAQKQAIDFVLKLESEGFNTPKALEIAKVSIKKSDRVKFLGRVTTAKKLSENGRDKTTKVLKAIQKEFVIGRKYDRTTFLNKVLNCLEKDNRINVFEFKQERNDKALKAVELVYEVKSGTNTFDKKVSKYFEICNFEDVLNGCDWVVNGKKNKADLVPF